MPLVIIPRSIISLATFPGVIVHEFAHQLSCRLTGTAVFEVCYYRFGNPAGYVRHERPRTPLRQFVIAMAPFIVNSVLGAVIAASAMIRAFTFFQPDALDLILIWLGISVSMYAFPSTGDARALLDNIRNNRASWLIEALVMPFILLIYFGAFITMFWGDVLYGIGVTTGFSKFLVDCWQ